MSKQILLSLDIGATNTRVLISDMQGKYIGFYRSMDYGDTNKAQQTILHALKKYSFELSDINSIGAGIAGYPYKEGVKDDLTREQGNQLLNIPGLTCKKIIENDAVAAYYTVFRLEIGIVAIAGTGSSVCWKTGNGEIHLDTCIGAGGENIRRECGITAQELISCAKMGNPRAIEICDIYAKKLADGINFNSKNINPEQKKLAFVGSLANNNYFQKRVIDNLDSNRFDILNHTLDPISGGIILILMGTGADIDDNILRETEIRIKNEITGIKQ